MNKKLFLLPVLLLLLILIGCRIDQGKKPDPVQPFTFYYRAASTSFDDENGLIRPEVRDLGNKVYTDEELFRLYLRGPLSSSLSSPFPKDVELLSAERSGSQISFSLRERYDSMTGINGSIADVCLARTALQLEGIRKVRIRVESTGGALLRDRVFTESDLLLYDNGEISENTELLLYFSDADSRFLLMEKRTIPLTKKEDLPRIVVEELLKGPRNAGMLQAIPEGTDLLDLNVDSGICYVDLNSDFFRNRPRSERTEQLAILSIVNSLCELDEVSQVQFYVEGRRLDLYTFLDLSAPFSPDGAAFGPVREEMNEFEAELCLPDQAMEALHRVPVRIRIRGAAAKEEALAAALFDRAAMNGLVNPLKDAPAPTSIQMVGSLCIITFRNDDFLSDDEATRTCQIRSLIATLCSLPEINRVQFTVGGDLLAFNDPDPDWFVRLPEEK